MVIKRDPIHSQWADTPLVLTEFIHEDQHAANECITEKELSSWNESTKTHLRCSLEHTSSIPRMFQMATRSLCITSKHFLRLKLRKCIPDAIALQYSVNRIRDIAKNLRNPLTLFSYSVVIIRRKSILLGTYTYFIEASILPDTSTRCARARAICVGSTRSSLESFLPNPSSLDIPGDSALIFSIVTLTSRCKV